MKKVGILLATYRPNKSYFEKLLKSLNEQTYSNVSLFVRDDSEDLMELQAISILLAQEITNFPFSLQANSQNMGSNETFEALTYDGEADYFAYCDQDDIWESDKIEKLLKKVQKEQSIFCYSDLSVINSNDELVAKSFKDLKKRAIPVFGEGDKIFEYFLTRSSVTGCTILMEAHIAKMAIPFNKHFNVHDQWLAFFAASQGKISYIDEPLVRYRIHKKNQVGTGIFAGINDKNDYQKKRLGSDLMKMEDLLSENTFSISQNRILEENLNCIKIRIAFNKKITPLKIIRMLKLIPRDKQLIVFEFIIGILPANFGKIIFRRIHGR